MQAYQYIYSFWLLCLSVLSLSLSQPLYAEPLPSPQQLKLKLGIAQAITVIEPHLLALENPSSQPRHQAKNSKASESMLNAAQVVYLGYPIQQVFAALGLQPAVPAKSDLAMPENAQRAAVAKQLAHYYVEFVCQDGYISRIPSDKFLHYQAYLVMAKQDGSAFKVDVHAQQQQDIALGPYYLVWDNLRSKPLQQLGSYHWPYQVTAIHIKPYQGAIAQAKLANDYCLTCHQLNGDGGRVLPINLAQIGQRYSQQQFIQLVLNPAASKPNSNMPALNPQLSQAQRQRIAEQLYQFFNSQAITTAQ